MLDSLFDLLVDVNGVMWGYVLIILLCGTGLFFTIKLKFIQIRDFGKGWNLLFKDFSFSGKRGENGEMTPFQAVSTAIAGQVGTGNLAGAATALISGGPGAIFWMWMSAFFGMATIYAEAVLAQNFKTVDKYEEVTGGPVYYIKAAFKGNLGKILSTAFAIFIVLALGLMGNMVQSNSIGTAFAGTFAENGIQINPIYIGIVLAILATFIFMGGTARLASVVEKLVPFMAVVYILGSLILLILNIRNFPEALRMIFVGAFNPSAVVGGAAGIGVQQAIRYGVARGLFSNEAGMGSTPHAHARAAARNPHEQGLVAMVSVFIDTFIILNLTAFSILCSGALATGASGIALPQAAFATAFGGFGSVFISICLFFFAFSTILSWHFFGAINIKHLFGEKSVKFYSLFVIAAIIVGSYLKVDFVWELSDFFNGLMVIPNVLALVALRKLVAKISKENDVKLD